METERCVLAGILKDLKNHLLAEREGNGRCPVFSGGKGGEGEGAAAPSPVPAMALSGVRAELGDCRRCGLGDLRKNIVFGEGNENADLVFVGEAPGEDEDRQGRPFVGRAGQLLTRIIEAMGLSRKDVYICNILKCRPPGNRNPRPEEIGACEPFLVKQLQTIQPRVICALGTFSAQTLLKVSDPISRMRGRLFNYQGIPLMPTFHPAYLLRNPGSKKQVWEDVQEIMKWLAADRGKVSAASAGGPPEEGKTI